MKQNVKSSKNSPKIDTTIESEGKKATAKSSQHFKDPKKYSNFGTFLNDLSKKSANNNGEIDDNQTIKVISVVCRLEEQCDTDLKTSDTRNSCETTPPDDAWPKMEVLLLGSDDQKHRVQNNVRIATRNLKVTLYYLAYALGRLVDELVMEDHVNSPDGQCCINKDDYVNIPTLVPFLISQLHVLRNPVLSGGQYAGGADRKPENIFEITLAVVATVFAHLAEKARKEGWKVFRKKNKKKDLRPFLRNHKYSSKRIYDHLLVLDALNKDTLNQSESNVHHKLNVAKKLLTAPGIPQLSPEQLLDVMEEAELCYDKAPQ